jgi:formiminotetrahydrofolate cyclodeaminase
VIKKVVEVLEVKKQKAEEKKFRVQKVAEKLATAIKVAIETLG